MLLVVTTTTIKSSASVSGITDCEAAAPGINAAMASVWGVELGVDSATVAVGAVMLGVDSAAGFSVTVSSGPTSAASVFDNPLSSNQVLLASLFFLLFSASWVKLLNWNQVDLFRPRSPALS